MQGGKGTWLAALVDQRCVRLCHVEDITGVARVLGWADVPGHPGTALDEALVQLTSFTGSRYLDDKGHLLSTRVAAGWGCDALGVCYGAVPPLRVLLAGLTESLSMTAARLALQHAYAQEAGALVATPALNATQTAEALSRSRPDVVLIVGGSDGGARAPVERLSHFLIRAIGRFPPERQPQVLCAANRDVCEALPAEWQWMKLPNVLPTPQAMNWTPVAQALQQLHEARCAGEPGYQRLHRWTIPHGCLAPDDVAKRLLRFWRSRFGLQRVAGGWWVGDQLLTLHTHDGRTFAQAWNTPAAGVPALPRPLRERQVQGAVWAGEIAHKPSTAVQRLVHGGYRRSSPRLWVDQPGVSLALASLAIRVGRPGIDALLLDGLLPAGKDASYAG